MSNGGTLFNILAAFRPNRGLFDALKQDAQFLLAVPTRSIRRHGGGRAWRAFSSHAVGDEASSRSPSTDEPCVHNNSQRALALVPNR